MVFKAWRCLILPRNGLKDVLFGVKPAFVVVSERGVLHYWRALLSVAVDRHTGIHTYGLFHHDGV